MTIRYTHVRNFGRKGKRNATVAYELDEAKGIVNFGVTVCSTKEQFNKKEGRAYATGRLVVMPNVVEVNVIGSDRYFAIREWLRSYVVLTVD